MHFANIVFVVHVIVFVYGLFGWLIDHSIWIYVSTLLGMLVLDIYFGYCILSKWEFDLRKKVNPDVDYPYHFSSYYTDRLLGKQLSPTFFTKAIYTFLVFSIGINTFLALYV